MKKLYQRFDLVRFARLIISDPVYLTIGIAFIMTSMVMFISRGIYASQWRNFKLQMVGEFHGLVLDVFFVGIVMVLINRVSERKKSIEYYKEELEDLRFRTDAENNDKGPLAVQWHHSDYVRLRVLKAIKALSRYQVREMVLDHVNFSGGRFPNINLHRSNLCKSIAHGVNLKHAILSSTNLCAVEFNDGSMEYADLSGTCANGAQFLNTSLIGADLSNSKFIHTNFANAKLNKSSFVKSKVSGAIFDGAILINTDFRLCEGLTVQQILKARYRYNCKFDADFAKKIENFEKIKNGANPSSNGQPPEQILLQQAG